MKLNREQIVKELMMFIEDMPADLHLGFTRTVKFREFLTDTLALIREFTEENERQGRYLSDVANKNVQLLKENAQLKFFDLVTAQQVAKYFKEQYLKAKADTVRKMQEEARQMCFIIGDEEYVTLCDLDKIAKELLEEVSDG